MCPVTDDDGKLPNGLPEKLDTVEQLMMRRYAELNRGFFEIVDKDRNFKLAYSASRDMLPILRFCIPIAAELAAYHKKEYAEDGSALYKAVMLYVLCLTERDNSWEAMVAASRNMFATPEIAEASTVFGALLSYVILQYILIQPYMLETLGTVWPDRAEDLLSRLVQMQFLPKSKAKAVLAGLRDAGMCPKTGGIKHLLGRTSSFFGRLFGKKAKGPIFVPGTNLVGRCVEDGFQRWIKKLLETGEVELPGKESDAV